MQLYRRYQSALDESMAVAPGSPGRDMYFWLRVFDFLMVQLAKRLSFQYERHDRPRDEWASAIPSPLSDAPSIATPPLLDETEHFRWMSSLMNRGDADG